MGSTLRKLLPAVVLACGFSASLSADMQNDSSHTNQTSDDTRFREITPNAGPRVTNGADVFITADFIYWTARMEGLATAKTGIDDFDSAISLASGAVTPGSTYFPPTKFDPGFKVGIGLNLGHDGWDTYLNYTWFATNHSSTNTGSTTPGSTALVPTWDVAQASTFLSTDNFVNVESATGQFRLRFNNFDLELGRNYYVSQYLTLRPHAGLKGGWYKENYNVTYTNFLQPEVAENFDQLRVKFLQKNWWVGIRTGLDGAWYFDKNWSMFGDVALSALWGRFDVTRRDIADVTVTDPSSSVTVVNTAFEFHTAKPVVEFQLGLRYDYWFSDDDYHFGIEAAWEEQVWINQNNVFEVPVAYGANGDLSFQGLTVKLRFDF